MQQLGYSVRNYVPVGNLIVGMGYLVRRIMENSSQVGILAQTREKSTQKWLAPHSMLEKSLKSPLELKRDPQVEKYSSSFTNVFPLRDYLLHDQELIFKAIEEFCPKIISLSQDDNVSSDNIIVFSPNHEKGVIAEVETFDLKSIPEKLQSLRNQRNESTHWTHFSMSQRASIILIAAHKLLDQRSALASQIVYESGKSITEALADVDEAIDFIHYYCRCLSKYGKQQDIDSIGIVAAITPWNFPLAIPCGMITAPLLAGNTVVLKSAEQTPLIANSLVEIFYSSGVPKNALVHMIGVGETIGKSLVSSAFIDKVVFTGSEAVGTSIYYQMLLKRNEFDQPSFGAVTEMGGKNSIIITSSSDLDEVVGGVLYACFAHAGQKCSAASRLIVDEKIIDKLQDRLRHAIQDLKVGVSYDPETLINPLITIEEKNRILSQMEEILEEAVRHHGRIIVDRTAEKSPGNCLGPALIELPAKRAMNSQSYFQRELFGPIVHIVSYQGLEHAIELCNSGVYGLTTGVYSQSEDDIEFLSSKIKAGNIYINRPNTGARVAIEPFGGLHLSGTGPKAGGENYLSAFFKHRSCQENELKSHEEEGTDYNFSLHGPMTTLERIQTDYVGLARIFSLNLDQMSHFLSEIGKESLKDQLLWQIKELKGLLLSRKENRRIPGQSSYDDFLIAKTTGLLIDEGHKNKDNIFSEFLTALSTGAKITILVRNTESFQFWEQINQTISEYPVIARNTQVLFASPELLKNKIFECRFEFYILNTSFLSRDQIIKYVMSIKNTLDFLPAFIHPSTHSFQGNFELRTLRYISVRSFAVNTMRYGAPLTLEGQK